MDWFMKWIVHPTIGGIVTWMVWYAFWCLVGQCPVCLRWHEENKHDNR